MGETGILRLTDIDQQLYAKQVIQKKLGLEYVVALNLAPTTPEWLTRFGASPMKLGLDLRGGGTLFARGQYRRGHKQTNGYDSPPS